MRAVDTHKRGGLLLSRLCELTLSKMWGQMDGATLCSTDPPAHPELGVPPHTEEMQRRAAMMEWQLDEEAMQAVIEATEEVTQLANEAKAATPAAAAEDSERQRIHALAVRIARREAKKPASCEA